VKSAEIMAIKKTSTVASAVAITIVIGFYVGVFIMDYFKYLHAAVVKIFFWKFKNDKNIKTYI